MNNTEVSPLIKPVQKDFSQITVQKIHVTSEILTRRLRKAVQKALTAAKLSAIPYWKPLIKTVCLSSPHPCLFINSVALVESVI